MSNPLHGRRGSGLDEIARPHKHSGRAMAAQVLWEEPPAV